MIGGNRSAAKQSERAAYSISTPARQRYGGSKNRDTTRDAAATALRKRFGTAVSAVSFGRKQVTNRDVLECADEATQAARRGGQTKSAVCMCASDRWGQPRPVTNVTHDSAITPDYESVALNVRAVKKPAN